MFEAVSSIGIDCGFSIGNNVLTEMVLNKKRDWKKRFEKAQQINNSSIPLIGICLEDDVIDEKVDESSCENFLNAFTKLKLFYFKEKNLEI